MPTKAPTLVGIDVSRAELVVFAEGWKQAGTFPNNATGHARLAKKLTKKGRCAEVIVEATGPFHQDLAIAFDRTERLTVFVANPKRTSAFAKATHHRGKTDQIDAQVLVRYLRANRDQLQPFESPSERAIALRALMRRICALKEARTAEKNRRHSGAASQLMGSAAVAASSDAHIAFLDQQIEALTRHAYELICDDVLLLRRYQQLVSVTGIAQTSALALLAELAFLPADMTPRQWVAHAGLDPRPRDSGKRNGRRSISRAGNKYLRSALYFPAVVASTQCPHARAFKERLVERTGITMKAIIAVMRKLLVGINAMFRTDQPYRAELLFPPEVNG